MRNALMMFYIETPTAFVAKNMSELFIDEISHRRNHHHHWTTKSHSKNPYINSFFSKIQITSNEGC